MAKKYKFKLFFSDGDVEEAEDTYNSYDEAEEAAVEWISDFHAGGDVLELAGEDFIDDDPDIVVYEVKE